MLRFAILVAIYICVLSSRCSAVEEVGLGRSRMVECRKGPASPKKSGSITILDQYKALMSQKRKRREEDSFDIVLSMSNSLRNQPARIRRAFQMAEEFWEAEICGHKANGVGSVTIRASAPFIDGPFNILGSAGPTRTVRKGGFVYATQGEMEFDSADLNVLADDGDLVSTIVHEMAHVLGIGTLWESNDVFKPQQSRTKYLGASGNRKWKSEFGVNTNAPIETQGGPGTAGGHWDEPLYGERASPFSNSQNQNFRDALMTGWLNSNEFLADVTLGSFEDMGYILCNNNNPSTPSPPPPSPSPPPPSPSPPPPSPPSPPPSPPAPTTEASSSSTSSTSSDFLIFCGDGEKDKPFGEQCDDGNRRDGDGCDSNCQIEEGYRCRGRVTSRCKPICGDGLVVGKEQCDLGRDKNNRNKNGQNNRGCSRKCKVRRGWRCIGKSPSRCRKI